MANDVKMLWVEDDIEKIQTKTNLYIQQYGEAGAFHLVREVIQNAIDECIDTDSPGKNIYVSYDKEMDMITTEDDGRGFPEKDYPLDIFCTKLQAGSKFFREQSGGTAGEFGLGLTATCALGTFFRITSYRDKENYKHTIEFTEGRKTKDIKEKLTKNDKRHGSTVSFIPSKKFLGNDTKIPFDDVNEWIEKMSFFIPKGIKITVDLFKGIKLKKTYVYESQPFKKLLDKVVGDNKVSSRCEFNGDDIYEDVIRGTILDSGNEVNHERKIDRNIHIDVALAYNQDSNETIYDSYCNFTNTTDGGIHIDTLEQCFCRYMTSKVYATMTDAQKEKTKILWEDIKSGLSAVINLSTNAQVDFVGNAKQKIGNTKLIPTIKNIINKGLNDFFDKNQSCLNEYIKIIKLNAKARIEMQKVKVATQRERMNSFKEFEMKKFIPCNNKGNKFRELRNLALIKPL